MSSTAWFMIFSGSSKFCRMLLILDLATRWNRSNRFIDKAVDEEEAVFPEGILKGLPTKVEGKGVVDR